MKSLIKIYKHNVYGIIGTLIFHILVVAVFLIAEVSRKQAVIRESIVEIEIPIEYISEEENQLLNTSDPDRPDSNVPSAKEADASEMTTNKPSAPGFSEPRNSFFDEDYEREIAAAQKLASEVDQQLSKEIVDINSISMPEDVTEGRKDEEIKNFVYTGESNIVYCLNKRYHLRLPIPVYLAKGGGTVIVDIMVSRDGTVISAKARPDASIRDEQVFLYSQVAARRTVFNADPSAPVTQNGTIHYTFIPQ